MKLKADSGSTKTEWVLLTDNNTEEYRCTTMGLNPLMMSRENISQVIMEMLDGHPQMRDAESVEFYGSGCTPEASLIIQGVISELFPKASHIDVGSDIIGAAVALCGDNEGIACILGTGANSCLWDGHQIVMHTPCLGYILGDEGGGAVMGRSLLNILYKGGDKPLLNDVSANPLYSLRETFEQEYSINMAGVIERVYRQPLANRWLASLSPFIHAHIDVPEIRSMVIENFRQFFRKNVQPYGRPDLPVNFVGSIAFYYQTLLNEAAQKEGFTLGKVLKTPL